MDRSEVDEDGRSDERRGGANMEKLVRMGGCVSFEGGSSADRCRIA